MRKGKQMTTPATLKNPDGDEFECIIDWHSWDSESEIEIDTIKITSFNGGFNPPDVLIYDTGWWYPLIKPHRVYFQNLEKQAIKAVHDWELDQQDNGSDDYE
jgi:hypothetical protein